MQLLFPVPGDLHKAPHEQQLGLLGGHDSGDLRDWVLDCDSHPTRGRPHPSGTGCASTKAGSATPSSTTTPEASMPNASSTKTSGNSSRHSRRAAQSTRLSTLQTIRGDLRPSMINRWSTTYTQRAFEREVARSRMWWTCFSCQRGCTGMLRKPPETSNFHHTGPARGRTRSPPRLRQQAGAPSSACAS